MHRQYRFLTDVLTGAKRIEGRPTASQIAAASAASWKILPHRTLRGEGFRVVIVWECETREVERLTRGWRRRSGVCEDFAELAIPGRRSWRMVRDSSEAAFQTDCSEGHRRPRSGA